MEQTFSIFDVDRLNPYEMEQFLEWDPSFDPVEYMLEVAIELDKLGKLRPCLLNSADERVGKTFMRIYVNPNGVVTIPRKGILDVYQRTMSSVIYNEHQDFSFDSYKTNYIPDNDFINQVQLLSTENIVKFIKTYARKGVLPLSVHINEYTNRIYSILRLGTFHKDNLIHSSDTTNSLANIEHLIISLCYRFAEEDRRKDIMNFLEQEYPDFYKRAVISRNYIYFASMSFNSSMVVGMIYSILGYNPFVVNTQRDLNDMIKLLVDEHKVNCDKLFDEVYKQLSVEETKYLINAVLAVCPESKFGKLQQQAINVRLPRLHIES